MRLRFRVKLRILRLKNGKQKYSVCERVQYVCGFGDRIAGHLNIVVPIEIVIMYRNLLGYGQRTCIREFSI